MGRERAIDAARAARASLGLGATEPIPDLLASIETRARLPIAVVPLRESTAGAYVVQPRGQLVLVNSAQWHTRARFTLAHELGHAHLGHGPVFDDVAAVTGGRRHDPKEVEANAYAAELLEPEAGVRAWWDAHREGPPSTEDVVRLAVEFGVSAEVARYRMQESGCLPSRVVARRLDQEIREG